MPIDPFMAPFHADKETLNQWSYILTHPKTFRRSRSGDDTTLSGDREYPLSWWLKKVGKGRGGRGRVSRMLDALQTHLGIDIDTASPTFAISGNLLLAAGYIIHPEKYHVQGQVLEELVPPSLEITEELTLPEEERLPENIFAPEQPEE